MEIKGLAHRGYPQKFPENTIRGFRAALELGFTHVELDVHLTRDGVPVVIHDPSVNRTTNGQGLVKSYTLQELRELDAGDGERIPTLEEALLFAKDRMIVDIELKQTGDFYPGLEEAAVDVIRRTGMEKQVIVTSFDHYAVERTRKLHNGLDLGLIIYGAAPAVFPYMKEWNIRYLSMKYVFLTQAYMEMCRAENVQLIVWTPDDEKTLSSLTAYSDLLVCTNNLEGWAAALRQA
ncbi:glycerophosphodiester phosphodiesterase [Paenibacillus naphthalenovorans]|uniref:glycerophosphodiester phosphodiesterase n=1 Tax=Paenibacillus naphthalenovorans TaxID=162209 RepID=UPI00089193F0|nr:glycerophosphodiester phosphodiesterase family protein [Paenibacillus naphthalenovorans]SDI93791.1 glycerophosphoryl diester phosphodiesterase [Paenibacillus naphthalenovorans]